jgi:hypothetical protein
VYLKCLFRGVSFDWSRFLDKNLLTWQPKIEGKKRGRTPGVPPLSHSSGEYGEWGPASAIHTSREYQPPIGPKETKALSPKYTK